MLVPSKLEKDIVYSLIFHEYEEFLKISSNSSVDLEKVVSIISSNRIEHFVLNKINSKFMINELSANFFDQLEICYLKKTIPTLKIIEKIFLLSDKLQKNNLDHVFLKGIALYNHKKKYMRSMRDIDILVNPKDVTQVVSLAKSLGFKFRNINFEQSDSFITSSSFYDLPPMVDRSGVLLEIHFRITTGNTNCSLKENIFKSKRLIKVHGKNVFIPCPNSLFNHLVYHASKKGNFDVGLSALVDLIQLNEEIDKNTVLRISESIELRKITELFFELIEFRKNKKIILSENAEKLKEILILPSINSKITEILLQDSFLKKFKKIKGSLFVSKTHLQKEFGINKNLPLFFYLLKRWKRLAITVSTSLFFILKNLKFVFTRTDFIKDLLKN